MIEDEAGQLGETARLDPAPNGALTLDLKPGAFVLPRDIPGPCVVGMWTARMPKMRRTPAHPWFRMRMGVDHLRVTMAAFPSVIQATPPTDVPRRGCGSCTIRSAATMPAF